MSPFGALLARPRAKPLACACAVAWLANMSLGLAIVLLVEHATGSFSVAGAATGAFAAGAGALAPFRGRLVDRHGRRALLSFAAAHTLALVALLVAAERGWSSAALIAAAACAGAVVPPLIATARALWPHVAGAELRRTGHALNALLGDLGAVLGPAAAGALAALQGPATALAAVATSPLASAALLAWVMEGGGRRPRTTSSATAAAARALPRDAPRGIASASAAPRAGGSPPRAAPTATAPRTASAGVRSSRAAPTATTPRAAPAGGRSSRAAPRGGSRGAAPARGRGGVLRRNAGMQTVMAADVVLGVVLGAIDVVAPALAQRDGGAALGAVPLAAFAAGSVLSSAWTGTSRDAGRPQQRFVAGFALCALVLPACLLARSVWSLSVVLAAAGVGYGLLNVGLLELLDELVPERHAVEALTWLTSAQGLGLALGATAAGALAAASPAHALVLLAVAAPVGAAVTYARRKTLHPRRADAGDPLHPRGAGPSDALHPRRADPSDEEDRRISAPEQQ